MKKAHMQRLLVVVKFCQNLSNIDTLLITELGEGGIIAVINRGGGHHSSDHRVVICVSINNYHLSKINSIQHNVIKFINDLQQVGGFYWGSLFPPPIKLKY